MTDKIKAVTVRFPLSIWRELNWAKALGEIGTIQAGVIEGAEGLIRHLKMRRPKRRKEKEE